MARTAAKGDDLPHRRAANHLGDLVGRALEAQKPGQIFLLEDPVGYGAASVLRATRLACLSGHHGEAAKRAATLPDRLDMVSGLEDLLFELALAAGEVPRDEVLDWRRKIGEDVFAMDVREYIAEELGRRGPLVVFIPRFDRAVGRFMPKKSERAKRGAKRRTGEDWTLRGLLSAWPVVVAGAAPPHWRPGADDAFFGGYRSVRPFLCDKEDIAHIAGRLGSLPKSTRATLGELAEAFDGRAELVEAAAAQLALNREYSAEDVFDELAASPPAALVELLEEASPEERRALSAAVSRERAFQAADLEHATGMNTNSLSTYLARLAEKGLVAPDRHVGPKPSYRFRDPVVRRLFARMVAAPDHPAESDAAAT